MKPFSYHCQIIGVSSLVVLASQVYAASPAAVVIFASEGVSRLEGSIAKPVIKGDEIFPGQTILTGRGRVQLKFSDGGFVGLDPQTRFLVDSYNYNSAKPIEGKVGLNLVSGGLRAITGLIGKAKPENVKLTTPTATIGVRGTEIRVETGVDGTMVTVATGGVSLGAPTGNGPLTIINPGETGGQNPAGNAPPPTVVNQPPPPPAPPPPPPAKLGDTTAKPDPVKGGVIVVPNTTGGGSDITLPNVTVPNVTLPNVTVPNVTAPNTTTPNVTTPNVTNPNVTLPNTTNPNVTQPNVTTPNVTTVTLGSNQTPWSGIHSKPSSPNITQDSAGLVQFLVNITTPVNGTGSSMVTVTDVNLFANTSYTNPNTSDTAGRQFLIDFSSGNISSNTAFAQDFLIAGRDVNATLGVNGSNFSNTGHFVAGNALTMLPMNGTATYNMTGQSLPTCSGTNGCDGNKVTNSSLGINFASPATSSNFTLVMGNGTGTLFNQTTALNLTGPGQFSANTGSLQTSVSLMGNHAVNAGALYRVNTCSTVGVVNGAITYTRGPIDPIVLPPPVEPLFTVTDVAGLRSSATTFNPQTLTGNYSIPQNQFAIDFNTAVVSGYVIPDLLLLGREVTGNISNQTAVTTQHVVIGSPLTNVPSFGTATYTMLCQTAPTCSGTQGCLGNSVTCSTIGIDFAKPATSTQFTIVIGQGQGVAYSLTTPLIMNTQTPGQFTANNSGLQATVNLMGNSASSAGAVYNVSSGASFGSMNGAIGYTRGELIQPPPPPNQAVVLGTPQAPWQGLYNNPDFNDIEQRAVQYTQYFVDVNGTITSAARFATANYTQPLIATQGGNFTVNWASGNLSTAPADPNFLMVGTYLNANGTALFDANVAANTGVNSSGQPGHFVIGSRLTELPTSGTATYNLVGASTPSCSGMYGCLGNVVKSSSLTVNFATPATSSTFSMVIAQPNSCVTTSVANNVPMVRNPNNPGQFTGNAVINDGSQTLQFNVGLLGANASGAGALYRVGNTNVGTINGAIAYKKQ